MNMPRLAEELRELVSEAAVEIANLDSPDNIVCRRLRAMQNRLQTGLSGESLRKFTASETELPQLAAAKKSQVG
jgi:hypothetical protein